MNGPAPDDGTPPRDARRLIVLWLCWVLMAALLMAAGVIGFC